MISVYFSDQNAARKTNEEVCNDEANDQRQRPSPEGQRPIGSEEEEGRRSERGQDDGGPSGLVGPLLSVQHGPRAPVSRVDRHQLCQLFNQKQDGCDAVYDGKCCFLSFYCTWNVNSTKYTYQHIPC
jgi:hypothetical protein